MCVYDDRVFMIPYADPGYVRSFFLVLACYHKRSDPGFVCSLLFVLPDVYILFFLCLCVPPCVRCVYGCCLVPFVMRDCQNHRHTCPVCNDTIVIG